MEKNIMQDIKPVSRSVPKRVNDFAPSKINPAKSLPKEIPFIPNEPKHSSRHGLWLIAVVCIIALGASLSFLFESAVVNVYPKSIPVAFDSTDVFVATKDSNDTDSLSYTVMSLSGDTSVTLPSSETKNVQNFATGKVTLFNNYSNIPFKIVKNTPIKASNGNLYKINNLVYIPGYTTTAKPSAISPNIKFLQFYNV